MIVTFQNIFSSMVDFRDVVAVLPCNPTNKRRKNLCGCAEKANRQWAFLGFLLSSYVEPDTENAFANWLAPKKGALFSIIHFFGSFCVYYIPHNYVIPQAMPHAMPQTHSAFYPHSLVLQDHHQPHIHSKARALTTTVKWPSSSLSLRLECLIFSLINGRIPFLTNFSKFV